jgi:hypothetical protein
MTDDEKTIHDTTAKQWAVIIVANIVCLGIFGCIGYGVYQLCVMACAVGAYGW